MNDVINIRDDYSRTPGPRMIDEGKFSGEDFRKKILTEAVKLAIDSNYKLKVILDGTAGFPPSFLDEAFGGLVRHEGLDPHAVKGHIEIVSDEEPYLVQEVFDAIDQKK